jgi:hypothetical protein
VRLPIPFEWAGERYEDAEVKSATAGVIADTNKSMRDGNWYNAMQTFTSGCLERLGSKTDVVGIRQAVREMPYPDAEFIAVQVFRKMGAEDRINALYTCPRQGCGHTIKDEEDRVGDLPVVSCEEPLVAHRDFDPPVEVATLQGEVLCEVQGIDIRIPSLGELARAFSKYGEADLVRVEFAAYVAATSMLNGEPPAKNWVATWGMMAFNRMSAEDVNAITEDFRRYGIQSRVTKTCPKCDAEWEAEVSTASFFASGLRSKQPSR